MKRITALLCAVLLVCTVCSCSDEIITGKNETVEPVDNVETLCAAVGVDMPLPSTAKNITCSIVNDFIGQIEFTFNSIIYNPITYSEKFIHTQFCFYNITPTIEYNNISTIF